MRGLDQLQSLLTFHTGQGHHEIGSDAEATFRTRTDADLCGHGRIAGDLRVELTSRDLQGAEEAGRVTRRKELLGVRPFAAGAAELFGRSELHLEAAISRAGFAVATTGGGG